MAKTSSRRVSAIVIPKNPESVFNALRDHTYTSMRHRDLLIERVAKNTRWSLATLSCIKDLDERNRITLAKRVAKHVAWAYEMLLNTERPRGIRFQEILVDGIVNSRSMDFDYYAFATLRDISGLTKPQRYFLVMKIYPTKYCDRALDIVNLDSDFKTILRGYPL